MVYCFTWSFKNFRYVFKSWWSISLKLFDSGFLNWASKGFKIKISITKAKKNTYITMSTTSFGYMIIYDKWMMVTLCWWKFLGVGDIFWILVSDPYVIWNRFWLVSSPTSQICRLQISNIRHQHQWKPLSWL